ncbi:long-chain acyl-CoA synthetase [Burkholderia sp. GAS332]|nr:long-chain acyl-CoA synthetase [Burkholderia sp. GAS332]
MVNAQHVAGDAVDFDAMRTLGDIARYQAQHRPGAVALSFEGREIDYETFNRHSNQVAHKLLQQGVSKEQRIAYIGKNSDYFYEILFGAAKVGAVMTSIGWRLAPAEMAYMLEDSGAALLFAGPEVEVQVREALQLVRHPVEVVALEPGGLSSVLFEAWRSQGNPHDVEFRPSEEDVVLQLYTSGTTGRPKGAMLAHRSILSVRRAASKAGLNWSAWSTEDISLAAMPVFHVGGSVWGIVGLFHGVKSIVVREFDPSKVLDFIVQHNISKIFMVPSALRIVVNEPRARQVDFSRLRYIVYGSSPMPLDLLRQCMDVFGCGFCQTYGLTETCGTIVYLPPEDHDGSGNQRMRSAGIPMPGVEIKVVDEQGRTLPPGAVGEIMTRSDANMVGYWGMPEATARALDPEGWLRTGDAGYTDEDGYLYISDRIKDMIISGAENIYPAEVENVIYGHPAVADVAVIGVPDDKWGEAVKAVVVLHPGAAADASEIIAFAKSRIASFKAPKSVDFIDALPRNAAGKILRRELREPYWIGLERRVN